MLKRHQFWAIVTLLAMLMCMITGHEIMGGSRKKEQ